MAHHPTAETETRASSRSIHIDSKDVPTYCCTCFGRKGLRNTTNRKGSYHATANYSSGVVVRRWRWILWLLQVGDRRGPWDCRNGSANSTGRLYAWRVTLTRETNPYGQTMCAEAFNADSQLLEYYTQG